MPIRGLGSFGRSTVTANFAADPADVRRARLLVAAFLEQLRHNHDVVDIASLVTSELASFHALASSIERVESRAAPPAARGLSWEVPQGWQAGPERSMRLFTLVPEGATSTECYATLLPGDGGGAFDNFNRWRDQMGLAPMSLPEYEALAVRSVLGVEARLIDLRGDFTGMSGERVSGARLLGLICELGDRALFLKMTGPEGEVEAERAAFLELCDSLRFEAGP